MVRMVLFLFAAIFIVLAILFYFYVPKFIEKASLLQQQHDHLLRTCTISLYPNASIVGYGFDKVTENIQQKTAEIDGLWILNGQCNDNGKISAKREYFDPWEISYCDSHPETFQWEEIDHNNQEDFIGDACT